MCKSTINQLLEVLAFGRDLNDYIDRKGEELANGVITFFGCGVVEDDSLDNVLSKLGIKIIKKYPGYSIISDGEVKAYVGACYENNYGKCLEFNNLVLESEGVIELCPHCDYEVPLRASIKTYQQCLQCGNFIAPCYMCDTDKESCGTCSVS